MYNVKTFMKMTFFVLERKKKKKTKLALTQKLVSHLLDVLIAIMLNVLCLDM